MKLTTATAIALSAIPLVCAEPTQLKLFHRVFHPAAGPTPYAHRGTLLIDEHNAVSFQFASSFADDLATFGDALRTVGQEAHLALYQIALERSGDKTEAEWDISSVKTVSWSSGTAWPSVIDASPCHTHSVAIRTVSLAQSLV
jgi:hypothetical protein